MLHLLSQTSVLGSLMSCTLLLLQAPTIADDTAVRRKEERIVFWRNERLASMTRDGKSITWLSPVPRRGSTEILFQSCLRLSPDGKRLTYGIWDSQADTRPAGVVSGIRLYVRDLEKTEGDADLKVEGHFWCWSPDSAKLAVSSLDDDPNLKDFRFKHWLVDGKTGEQTKLNVPADHAISDWSPDGKWFLTFSNLGSLTGIALNPQLNLVRTDGSETRALAHKGQPGLAGRFSPDGKQVLLQSTTKDATNRLFLISLADGSTRQVTQELNATIMGYSWSPDGNRIAYAWRQHHANAQPNIETESFLVIVDRDGKNPVTVLTERSDNPSTNRFGALDWR